MPLLKRRPLIALLIAASLMAGCATVRFTATGDPQSPYQGPVKILKAYPEDTDYLEIGWVSADGDFNTPWSELLGLMQKEAASRGANAIVLPKEIAKSFIVL